jgi:hypothetical protein
MSGGPFLTNWASRETVVQLPHDFAMLGYLMFNHRIPRILYQEGGLAYHYCDSAGLLGILGTHRFWASNAVFLNDPTEGSYALDVARDFLEGRRTATGVKGKFAAAVLERIDAGSDTDLYVVSFSRDGDLLSQWRGYGDFGRGYSLGFDMAKLNPPLELGWMIEVLYDPGHLRSTLEDIFEIYTEFLDSEGRLADFDDAAEWCSPVLNLLAQGFKHPSYQQEREVRLLFKRGRNPEQPDGDRAWHGLPISYRARGSNIVSYLDTGLDHPTVDQKTHLPLSRIIVGPGVSFAQNEGSIRGYLASQGYKDVEITASAIPFRP